MYQVDPNILLLASVFLTILVTVRAIILSKRNFEQQQLLINTNESLAEIQQELEDLKKKRESVDNFRDNLQRAEMVKRVQQNAFNSEKLRRNNNPDPPERYQYIHALTEKDISISDIASILSLSVAETEQLVTLAKISRQ